MQQIEFEVIGNTARHLKGDAILVEGDGLEIVFHDLPSGAAIFEAGIGKACSIYPINGNKARIFRSHLKAGILSGKVQIVDSSGKITQVIVCENVYVSSVHSQVEEPLLAYPDLGGILTRLNETEKALNEAKAAYEAKTQELEEKLDDLNAVCTEAVTRLDAVQKAWDINGIYE